MSAKKKMLSFEEFQSGEPVVIGILAGDCGSKEPNEETVFHSNILRGSG